VNYLYKMKNLNFYGLDSNNNRQLRMAIDTSGNIGLGIGTPSTRLEMIGDLSLNGNIIHNGSVFASLTKIDETTDVSLNNLKVHGDLSANDASFNVVDISSINTSSTSFMNSIIPNANDTYSLGDISNVWKDIYIGPGSLYIDGQKVIESDSSTIVVAADQNQNMKINTTGSGVLQLESAQGLEITSTGSGNITIGSTSTGTVRITDNIILSSGVEIQNETDATVKINDGLNVTGDYLQNGTNINTIYATLASPTLTGTPLAPTASSGTNTTQIATTAFVTTAVDNLIGSAPGALDTLEELAQALDNSHNYSTIITTKLTTIETNLNTKQNIITETDDVSLNTLKVHGDLSANDASFNVIDATSIGIGTIASSYKLNVDGTANFTGDVSMNDVSMNGGLSVVGNVSLNNNLKVNGDLSANDASFNVIDTTSIGIGTAASSYKLNVDGTANFTGDVSMNDVSMNDVNMNDVSMNGGLSVVGNVSLNNNLKVNGDLSANDASFNVIDATSIGIGTIASSYKLNVDGTANFTGDVSMNDVNMNDVNMNDVNMNGVLSVVGDVSLNTLKVNGDLSANDASFNVIDATSIGIGTTVSSYKLNVDGTANFTGDVSMNDVSMNDIAVNGTLSVVGDVEMNNNLTVNKNISINDDLTVDDNVGIGITASSTYKLNVDGSANFTGDVSMNDINTNDINANGTLSVIGDVSLNTLKVHGDLSANDASFNVIDTTSIGIGTTSSSYKLNVDGTANFTGDVSMNDVSMNGGLTVDGTINANAIFIQGNEISSSGGGGSTDITTSSITDLSDVDISYSNISDGQALVWNDASGVWKPGTVSSGSGTTIDSNTDISVNNLDVSGNLDVGKVNVPISSAYTVSYEYHNWDKHGGGPFVAGFEGDNLYRTDTTYLNGTAGDPGTAVDRMNTYNLWSSGETFDMKDISGNSGSVSNVRALFYRGTSSSNTLELSANGVSSSITSSQRNDTGFVYFFELRSPWTTGHSNAAYQRDPIEYVIAGTLDNLGDTPMVNSNTTLSSSQITSINDMNWQIICRYHFTDDSNYFNTSGNDIFNPLSSQLDLSYCTVNNSGASFYDINGRNTQAGSYDYSKWYYVLKTTTPNLPLYKGFCVFVMDSTASTVGLKTFNIQVGKSESGGYDLPAMSVSNTLSYLKVPIKVDGTVKATGSITANTTITNSDDRLKHNEKYVDNAISIINKLNPMRYFKTAELKDKSYNFPLDISGVPITTMNYHEETGIIAQDIDTIPELSHTLRQGNDNVPYGIDYNSIFCTHIAATKELYSIINNYKSIVEGQEQEIENLKVVNQDMNNQLNTVLNENNTLKDDIIHLTNQINTIKEHLGLQ
jgi:cytoskeletal protein CcmA (bactofilin family)